MAAFIFEDDTGILECIAFPDVYKENSDIILKNNLLVLTGSIDRSEKGIKFLLREVSRLEEAFQQRGLKVEITLDEEQVKGKELAELKSLLSSRPGNAPVYVRLRSGETETLFLTEESITPDFGIIEEVTGLLGEGSLRIIRNNGHSPEGIAGRRPGRKHGKTNVRKQ